MKLGLYDAWRAELVDPREWERVRRIGWLGAIRTSGWMRPLRIPPLVRQGRRLVSKEDA